MTNPDSILKSRDINKWKKKSRDITLPTKICLVKAMVFPVVMYRCESWTIKKAERQRIDAFELWCWRRILRTPWTAWRSHQSILKEISPEYSLEGLMLKLKLQYFGHLMRRTDSLEKTLMLGKIEEKGTTGWDGWLASLTQWTWVWVSSELVMDREDWRAAVHGVAKAGHDWVIELKLDGGAHLSKNASHQHFTHDVIRALKFLSVPQPFTYPKQTKPHILGFHRHATEYIHLDEKEICLLHSGQL